MQLYRSVPGRLLGYGELQFETVSQDQRFWAYYYVPYPEQLFLELYNIIFSGEIYQEATRGRRITVEI
jgi:hypothetical protein